jgi:divalent metal cation (Fe/Co/Zn/Cd) transporter
MRSKHYEKYLRNLLEGIIFLTVGIFLIFYSAMTGVQKKDWYLWAAGIAVVINTGIFFLGTAFVHKVKADIIRKQRHQKEEYQEYTLEK